ncbi:MAG: hypothetical protein Q7I99_04350 [Acholeplasmataceae bacterium]|nr:hypothetical protein [Acholeplasmataceae bacterium]
MIGYRHMSPVLYKQAYLFRVTASHSSISVGVSSNNGAISGNQNSSRWIQIAVGAIPDIIIGARYLLANGMHSKFAYATNARYMHPTMGGTWRWFGKSGSSLANFGNLAQGTFRQILTGDAKAGFGTIAKSMGSTVALHAVINFGFNLYENNWQVDSNMLIDTGIDTAIGVGAYLMASGTMSLITAGVVMAGFAVPGIVVVGGVIVLSMGFDWLIRKAKGYHN